MSSTQVSTDPPATRRRRTLPAGLALTGAAITFTSLYLAAGALTPLLVVYKDQWKFPASLLTLAFAVYAIGFLAALLTLGSLSDHIGRRPVLIGALIIQLASNVMFLVAPDIGWVIAGRIVQGVAGGAATTAFTATLGTVPTVFWYTAVALLLALLSLGGQLLLSRGARSVIRLVHTPAS